MSTLTDTMMSVGGYHEYTRGCSVHWGIHTNSIVFPMTSPHISDILQCTHDIPHCTHDIPWCTEHPPLYCTPPVYCTDTMQGENSSVNEALSVDR